MGKGGGGTDYETQGRGGGREIGGEEGWDGDGGAPCSESSGGTRSWRGAAALAIVIAAAATARAASMDEELADRQRATARDERDLEDAEERGGRSPRDAWEFGSRGARGGDDDAGIQYLFIVENIIQYQDFPVTC
jgi:hypothetical protein